MQEIRSLFEYYWPDFQPQEVLSPHGLALWQSSGVCPLRYEALDHLQSFRDHIGSPLIINNGEHQRRGWRSPVENALIHGKNSFSFHIAGVAFDMHSPILSPLQLMAHAHEFGGWKGFGMYQTFIHLDIRSGPPAQWQG